MANNRSRYFADNQVGSFIKWAGGKGQLLEQYRRFFPATLEGRHYVEPFMGSAAVFFFVKQNLNPSQCTLLDINPELVNTFRQLRDNVETVIGILTEHKERHNAPDLTEEARKEYYYTVRALDADLTRLSPEERAARFVYLNKTCFNGLHRLNSRGRFNVPIGSYKCPAIFDADHLRQVSCLLQGVTIEECPFQECGRFIRNRDFVYFDPPYEPLSRTSSFTSYAKDDFTQENQRELRDLVSRLSTRCDWMVSQSTAPFILDLFDAPEFQVHRVLATRAINSVGEGRGKIEELVITSYPVPPLTAHPREKVVTLFPEA